MAKEKKKSKKFGFHLQETSIPPPQSASLSKVQTETQTSIRTSAFDSGWILCSAAILKGATPLSALRQTQSDHRNIAFEKKSIVGRKWEENYMDESLSPFYFFHCTFRPHVAARLRAGTALPGSHSRVCRAYPALRPPLRRQV